MLAISMKKKGYQVRLVERRADPRYAKSEGRSINLVVTSRGKKTLEDAGLWEEVRNLTMPVAGRKMHPIQGRLAYQPYGIYDHEVNYSVSRSGLNNFLINEAEKQGIDILFEHELEGGTLADGVLDFKTPQGVVQLAASSFIGTDGSGSKLRPLIVATEGDGAQETIQPLGAFYKELKMPAALDGQYPMDSNSLHIWPRGHHMLMGLPNEDGSFTMTLFVPDQGEHAFGAIKENIPQYFEDFYPDVIPLIPDYLQQFEANPEGFLGTVKCNTWYSGDRAVLLGDAAHGIVPFFGQGMNSGFEDITVFLDLLTSGQPLEDVYGNFQSIQKPNADAIADMAIENFVEMRDRVGDSKFLALKALERFLEEHLSQKFRSRYSMVTFSRIPYKHVQQIGLVQKETLSLIGKGGTEGPENIDLKEAEAVIDGLYTKEVRRLGIDLQF